MNILVIKTSNRELSISNQLADMILQEYQKNNMDSCNVQVLDASDLPHIDAIYAENLRNPANNLLQSNSLDLSDRLIEQLDHADVVIIATPMHNFTIPSSLKAWIDHIVRIGKTFTATSQGKMGRLADRPVYIAVSTGGMLRDKQPDFLTHYLQTIFATIGISSVYFFVMEGTVFGEEYVKQEWAQIKHKVRNHFSKNIYQ